MPRPPADPGEALISSAPEFDAARTLLGPGAVGLYGAGQTGRRVLEAIRRSGGRVSFFLDAAADHLREVEGVPVLAPFADDPDPRIRSVPIVLTVFNRDVDTVEIAHRLSERGYGPLISYLDFHALHRQTMGDHFWLGDPALMREASASIAATERLWADPLSRSVFRSLVELYRQRNPTLAPPPSPRGEEYLAPDVDGWPPGPTVRIADCGAYDGDTLDRIREAGLVVEAAACFEPDPENFRRLCDRVAQWPAAQRRGLVLWPCGVSSTTSARGFSSGFGEASRLSDTDTGREISCVALDDALPGFAPNFLKLDVEGAEEEAMAGAARILAENRPWIALSVYHRPADLWRLPAIVDDWGLGYRLFLRSYGFNGFDTVCYAVPPRL